MAGLPQDDLTIIYYSANVIPLPFATSVRDQLKKAAEGLPIISVTHRPIIFGTNITVDLLRHHLSIYKQALIGAKEAKTEYIALCEDDVLYSPEHFKHRPSSGKFAYNLGHWNLYTWSDPVFSWKGRRNLGQLICQRDLFIEAMGERFEKYHDDGVDLGIWAEPGKYERQLGVTPRESEVFWTNPPNVAFSHDSALSYENLGKRKRLGELRATSIPFWGSAEEVKEMYR